MGNECTYSWTSWAVLACTCDDAGSASAGSADGLGRPPSSVGEEATVATVLSTGTATSVGTGTGTGLATGTGTGTGSGTFTGNGTGTWTATVFVILTVFGGSLCLPT